MKRLYVPTRALEPLYPRPLYPFLARPLIFYTLFRISSFIFPPSFTVAGLLPEFLIIVCSSNAFWFFPWPLSPLYFFLIFVGPALLPLPFLGLFPPARKDGCGKSATFPSLLCSFYISRGPLVFRHNSSQPVWTFRPVSIFSEPFVLVLSNPEQCFAKFARRYIGLSFFFLAVFINAFSLFISLFCQNLYLLIA